MACVRGIGLSGSSVESFCKFLAVYMRGCGCAVKYYEIFRRRNDEVLIDKAMKTGMGL